MTGLGLAADAAALSGRRADLAPAGLMKLRCRLAAARAASWSRATMALTHTLFNRLLV
jgi:hypothetical protein